MDVNGAVNNTAYQPIMTASAPSAAAPAPTQAVPEAAPQEKPVEVAVQEHVAESVALAKAEKHAEKASNEYLEKTISQVNKSLNTYNRELSISVHKQTGRIMVKVMDTQEKRIIREIPPERVLDAFAKTLEMAGILVDKKR